MKEMHGKENDWKSKQAKQKRGNAYVHGLLETTTHKLKSCLVHLDPPLIRLCIFFAEPKHSEKG